MEQVSRKDQLDPGGVELRVCDVADLSTDHIGGGNGTMFEPLLGPETQ